MPEPKPTIPTPSAPTKIQRATIELRSAADVGVLSITGLIDEQFTGFGALPSTLRNLVIDVSKITRMTSFGVRQWLKAMDALPKGIADVYLLGCPTFFVDQLN